MELLSSDNISKVGNKAKVTGFTKGGEGRVFVRVKVPTGTETTRKDYNLKIRKPKYHYNC